MSGELRDDGEEVDLVRDQVRQIVRYKGLIAAGLVVGLLGGAYLALGGSDTYAASSEVMVRAATADPFAAGATPDKGIDIGTERQTAMSTSVAAGAAKAVKQPVRKLQHCIQVTNPPNTLVLRFTCSAANGKDAAAWVNAFTKSYLDSRESETRTTIKKMVKGYQDQLNPLVKQRNDLLDQINGTSDSQVIGTLVSVQTNLLSRITELNGDISGLRALDTTPGVVIKPGTVPEAPTGPGLPLMLGLGTGVGLALGLLAAWLRLVFDPRPRSEGEVTRAMDAPVLGTLPRRRGRRARREAQPLLAEGQSGGRLAEEYRAIAFRLSHDRRFSERRRLLVVAPRGDSDVAAAVAVNLSASFAEMGKEVLLVEADLRTPSLSGRLRSADPGRPGWARTPGLGDGGWPAGLQLPVDAGEYGSFDLVPGRRVRNVARALTSGPAGRLFAEADEPGTAVVVLAPAVLSYADALALADRVDGVVVVCDPAEVHRDDLVRVRELIEGAGGAVLGTVLHRTAPEAGRSRFGLRRSGTGHRTPTSANARTEPAVEPATTTAPERHPVP
ncbi:Chromosome partitioning ATPase, Mrp family, contains Fe-S cluster [Actinacidiphila yanglinensis]|uniref:Chromosome partitioning ATPase, Mrp family, contains Fe-S cluster n=1 Tax=Actinacidiphila yanglinensis TaxID=310779 RepID=A0A1H5SZM9_9ACTN|nr:CpsD/CapB family tyrosine-protein kinase [Actinacidiphila yanglinensis]SEF55247.1 Chromosome partitioning ATPase, Mrp family, contains Fe-S cluster [Actinacidiphila yanglinensis]